DEAERTQGMGRHRHGRRLAGTAGHGDDLACEARARVACHVHDGALRRLEPSLWHLERYLRRVAGENCRGPDRALGESAGCAALFDPLQAHGGNASGQEAFRVDENAGSAPSLGWTNAPYAARRNREVARVPAGFVTLAPFQPF